MIQLRCIGTRDSLGFIVEPAGLVTIFFDITFTLRRTPNGNRLVRILAVYVKEAGGYKCTYGNQSSARFLSEVRLR